MILNLSLYLDPNLTALVGTKEGSELKSLLLKNGIDLNHENSVTIVFPENIITMNYSFFKGFLADEVLFLGKESFLNKYSFIASEHIQSKTLNLIDSVFFRELK